MGLRAVNLPNTCLKTGCKAAKQVPQVQLFQRLAHLARLAFRAASPGEQFGPVAGAEKPDLAGLGVTWRIGPGPGPYL